MGWWGVCGLVGGGWVGGGWVGVEGLLKRNAYAAAAINRLREQRRL